MTISVHATKIVTETFIISGLIGDVHLVGHDEVFNAAQKCPSPQATRRPLALQFKRNYKG